MDDPARLPSADAELAEYRHIDGAPRLRQAAVLFLDQLGTQELVEEDPAGHLARTAEAVRLARRLGDLSDEYQVARWFSDNLLLAVRLPDREEGYEGPALRDRGFGILVINAAWLQLALVIGGITSRGGIDVGDFYADAEFFYGPALSRAYVLESRTAIWPRVVVGDEALLRMAHECATGDMSTYSAMLVADEDGEVFVNYFGDLPFTYEELDETIEPLKSHREVVIAGLEKYAQDEKLLAKYEWMAAFHDWTIGERLPAELAEPLLLDRARPREFKALDYEILGLPPPAPDDEEEDITDP